MTREHKFALILGFSVVLVAAILLSDHLSRARQDRGLSPELVTIPQPGIPVAIEPTAPLSNDRPLRDPGPSEVAGAGQDPGVVKVKNDVPPVVIPGPNDGAADHQDSSDLPVSTGKEQIVTIQAGDGLYKICARIYNNGGLYKELEAYNKNTPGFNPSNLKVGSTVRVPPKDVLTGKARLGTGKPDATDKPKIETSPLPPREDGIAAGKAKAYKVVAGDTGAVIAKKTLGDKNRWDDIAKLNPGVDPRGLKIGYELKIPAK